MLYALTIFIGAFLLFFVQPLMGRLVLPWFGGSAAVWTACLVFFQVVLLLGYLYAHALVRRLSPRGQAWTHVALLIVSAAFLPLWPSPALKPHGADDPTVHILLLLAATVGLPYMLLASTSPLLQAWFVRVQPQGAPYRLYALSNLGSLLALIGYVTVVEPRYALGVQAVAWSAGYGLFMVCASLCALRSIPPTGQPQAEFAEDVRADTEAAPGFGVQVLWLLFPACASVLLMAITHHVSQNVAPVPFLWVGLLSVYLLTFIICFEGHNLYWRWLYYPLLTASLGGMCYYLEDDRKFTSPWTLIPIFMASLFATCMVCHGELARLRPAPRYLTQFYLMFSLGGALGGVFTGLIAPRIFSGYFELHLAIAACPLLLFAVWLRDPQCRLYRLRWAGVWLLLLAGEACLAWFLAREVREMPSGTVARARNFYGVLTVSKIGVQKERMQLLNGNIIHGEQLTAAAHRRDPITYYGPKSGVGLAIAATRGSGPQRVGVVGLGAGTMAAYGRPGDAYRFYEIDPLDVDFARTHFTYLTDAPERLEIVMGDARLSMEQEAPQRYDVLAIDAFSGDAIPLHLLTLEAFGQYFRHLGPRGILAVHVTNRYLNLEPAVKAAADCYGHPVREVYLDDDDDICQESSMWALLALHPDAFARTPLKDAVEVEGIPAFRPWTDDYTNLLGVLKTGD